MTALPRAPAIGASAGLAGGAAMALASKGEQHFTRRPNSYIPGRALGRLLRLHDPDSDRWLRNMAMHYASAALAGAIRGVMSAANLRGPFASLMHTNVRLTFDQTLENLTATTDPNPDRVGVA